MPAFKARLDRLAKMVPDVKEGDEIVLTYVPGTGTKVTALGLTAERSKAGTLPTRSFRSGWALSRRRKISNRRCWASQSRSGAQAPQGKSLSLRRLRTTEP